LKKGQALKDFLIQDKSKPLCVEEMIVLFYAFSKELPQILEESQRENFKHNIYPYLLKNHPEIIEELTLQKFMTGGIERGLDKAFEDFFADSEDGQSYRGGRMIPLTILRKDLAFNKVMENIIEVLKGVAATEYFHLQSKRKSFDGVRGISA